MHSILIATILACSQENPLPTPPPVSWDPAVPMHSSLWDLQKAWDAGRRGELPGLAAERALPLDGAGRVRVELLRQAGPLAAADSLLRAAGAEPLARYHDRQGALVPIGGLAALARSLPAGVALVPPAIGYPDDVTGEGPGVIGSDTYRDLGSDGTGMTVAVIDFGYENFVAARSNGDAPSISQTTIIDYTLLGFESGGTHGTGCVEAVFDHAPGAQYRLYKSFGAIDLGLVVSDGLAAGVDVFSHSRSYYNLGWADNSGTACAAALAAAQGGAIFCTSAGNRAQTHCKGVFSDGDGDGWHQYSGSAERNDAVVADNQTINVHLSWDLSSGIHDYNIYLYDGGTLLASSTSLGTLYESVYWTNNTGSSVTVSIAVEKAFGGSVEFEYFTHNGSGSYTFQTAASSITSPSNAIHSRVVSVAAVDWTSFGSSSGTSGILKGYSSRGPSNGGAIVPRLSGPTDTVGFTYGFPGGFGGTSCATPNVAGALIAFWDSNSSWNSFSTTTLGIKQSALFADWGSSGTDNLYGAGGLILTPHTVGTRWLDASFGNGSASSSEPYLRLADAYAATPTGGRVLVVGASAGYPDAPSSAMTRAMDIESLVGTVVLGGN